MSAKPLSPDSPCIYFFSKDSQATVRLVQHLLVVFSAPKADLCSIVVLPQDTRSSIVEEMLDKAFEKAVQALKALGEETGINIKIFGAANPARGVLRHFHHWLNNRGLGIRSSDLGRNVARTLLIECGTGKVGVTYEALHPMGLDEMVPRGTARARLSPVGQHLALILTRSSINRNLALQAIEEHRGWKGLAPEHPEAYLTKNHPPPKTRFILIFDDCENLNVAEPWMEWVTRRFPEMSVCWVGYYLPPSLQEARQASLVLPLTPETQAEFKQSVGIVLNESMRPKKRKKT